MLKKRIIIIAIMTLKENWIKKEDNIKKYED
jgi:hypothetical protein